jgi:hypothetical protein
VAPAFGNRLGRVGIVVAVKVNILPGVAVVIAVWIEYVVLRVPREYLHSDQRNEVQT